MRGKHSVGGAHRPPRRAWHMRFGVFALALLVYSFLTIGFTAIRSAAQNSTASDTTTWKLRARSSSLTEIDGEKVIVLQYDTILHRDVLITSTRGEYYSDQLLAKFIGDVVITQQTMKMYGDRGQYDRAEGTAVLEENVRIVDRGWEVDCEQARFNRNTNKAWLIGNVVARDSSTTLRADRLIYDRITGQAEAFGRVVVTNADQGFQVEGRHGFYFRDTRQGIIDREPHLIVDPESPEPVTVDSDTMRVYPDSGLALAYYTVKILKGETVTQCDSAVIFDNDKRAELYGSPLARQERTSMSGEMMALYYNDEEVERIDIRGEAMLLEERADTVYSKFDNWIQGDTMALYLHENRVDSIRVIDNARSEYHPTTPGKVESNFISGDSMFFEFAGDSLSYVRVDGKAAGTYRFLDISAGQTVDSLAAVADTSLEYIPFDERAQEVVYSARSIDYYATTRDLVLDENAKLTYGNNTLAGKDIIYYSDLDLLDATGEPVLTEGGQKFFGSRMNYDMVDKTGLVSTGSTRFQEGFYTGEHVAKVGDNEMKVWRSEYTTCDLAVPHYHFKARVMKVYPDDKVVSGPIALYVGETPLFALPFMANTIKRGRRSGFLRPDFDIGITSTGDRFIRNVGYYWATNDYTDFRFQFDFNEDASLRGDVRNRYKVRYGFDGNVRYNFYRDLRTFRNEWTVEAVHNQTFFRDYRFGANLNFVSSDAAPSSINRIDQVDRVVNRQIRSTARLSKTWQSVGVGFSLTGDRTQNLDVVNPTATRLSMTFPNVTLSIPSRDLYFGEASRQGKEGFLEKLLSNTKFSPSLSGNRKWVEKDVEYRETITVNSGLSLQSPQRFGFLTISPTLSASNVTVYDALETFQRTDIDSVTSNPPDTTFTPYSFDSSTENTFSWSTGARASTNIYGTFYPTLGALRGIRHKVSPSASYNYRPKVGSRPADQSVSVSLQNSIDLKLSQGKKDKATAGQTGSADRVPGQPVGGPEGLAAADGTDEEQLRRIDNAVIWSLSASVDPDKDHARWSNISSRVNTSVFGSNVSLNQTYDPYKREVLSTTVTSGFRIAGSHPFGISSNVEVQELNVVARRDTAGQDSESGSGISIEETGDQLAPEERLEVKEGYLPWSASMDISYNKAGDSDARSTLRFSTQFDITRTWGITYSTVYDIVGHTVSGQNISIKRDLHCWSMSLARQKLGDEWQFYFKISLNAHPDIYAEQGRRGLGGGGGAFSGSVFR